MERENINAVMKVGRAKRVTQSRVDKYTLRITTSLDDCEFQLFNASELEKVAYHSCKFLPHNGSVDVRINVRRLDNIFDYDILSKSELRELMKQLELKKREYGYKGLDFDFSNYK